jgi:protein-disulfide isomerase
MQVIRKPLAAAVFVVLTSGGATAETVLGSKPGQHELEQKIRQYILDNPEVVLESVRRFQEREEAAQKQRSREAVNTHLRELHVGPSSVVAGGPSNQAEPVTIVAFIDYRCGYCKKANPTVTKLANAPGVRVVYKDFPILGPDSILAAQAALAADKQGKYEEFHRALMTTAASITPAALEELAAKLKLDITRLKKDMSSPEVEAALRRTHQLAEALGVQSTPTFVVGRDVLPGALTEEAFNAAIEAARQDSQTTRVQARAPQK